MLIDGGTTLSSSRNSSPNIVLTILNPNVGHVSRSGHLEVLERIPIPITTSVSTTNFHKKAKPRTSPKIERAHDNHYEEQPEKEEITLLVTPVQAPSTI